MTDEGIRFLDLPDERLHHLRYAVCYLCRSGERHSRRLTGKDIFELPFVLVETALLLFSSITYGMAAIAMYKNNKSQVVSWLALTWLFGAGFIGMEIYEFHHLIMEGFGGS